MQAIRTYIPEDSKFRVQRYAVAKGMTLQDAFGEVINSVLDEKGHAKDRLVLTDVQNKILEEISTALNQSPERTVQEMINYALLIYTTHISLREVIVAAAPLIMDEVVNHNPEIAKEILKGLQKSKPASPP